MSMTNQPIFKIGRATFKFDAVTIFNDHMMVISSVDENDLGKRVWPIVPNHLFVCAYLLSLSNIFFFFSTVF